MLTPTQSLPVRAACAAGMRLCDLLGRYATIHLCSFYSAAIPKPVDTSQTISSNQLTLLNHLGTLPSVAQYWDSPTVESELRNIDAASYADLELSRSEPTAVQREMAQRHGIVLPIGASRHDAAATLATALPPSIRSLAVLYGVLEYDVELPTSDSAARQLMRSAAQSRPHAHSLDIDLSPVAHSQMNELFNRLGYIGRLPFSYSSAQLMAACLRTILADVDDEARMRPLPSLDFRQSDLIRYLRSRRAIPGPGGTLRGMPAVLDVDLAAQPPVSRLAAARNILQLLQNHELCANPAGSVVEQLRQLGHSGAVPPSIGEAAMLLSELRDRCLSPKPSLLAALCAVGYGTDGSGSALHGVPVPDSVAHVKAVLRVLRRTDTDAATPATRTALRHLAELRRRTPVSAHAAAAAVAPWGRGTRGGDGGNEPATLGPCPSQLEVRAAIEDLPVSESALEHLMDLGWPGPMPSTHGAALALEDYLLHQKSSAAASAASSKHSNNPVISAAAGPQPPLNHDSNSSPAAAGGLGGQLRRPGGQQYGTNYHFPQFDSYDKYPRQQQLGFISRLASSPEEALIKIQIRGMFPGAVSEWYLPTMSYEEAEHVLGCLMAARRLVLERVSGAAYDEYVDRWSDAEADGDWWGMEWLWH